MKPIKLTIKITSVDEQKIGCHISNETENIRLNYLIAEGDIVFEDENNLMGVILKNKHQFEKVIRSAAKGKITVGQTINCVFIEDFNFLKDSDFTRIIRVDRRNEALKITTNETGLDNVHKIYADGSFAHKTGQSGFGGFTETPNGKREIFSQSFTGGSNNLMELLAVTEGLKRLQNIEKIQVNTDSRFVIRGLVQWVHFWRHNNWETAYGCKVKFADKWQDIDKLCENKLIEFRWIKGHSGNEEQSFCDELARRSANHLPS